MKFQDFIWIFIIIFISMIFVFPASREAFGQMTYQLPYVMGFIKTAILATMGEALVNRIKTKTYFTNGFVWKFIVWGFLGMGFVLVFKIFAYGVSGAQESGLLPLINDSSFGSKLLTAFLISLLMNLIFAPTFMILHRITDGYIDCGVRNVTFSKVINNIDWQFFFSFVILKTIPLFWIPAHTITFLLPENFRVLMAAYLSIVLGFILTISKIKKIV